jgi:hypothetical protein
MSIVRKGKPFWTVLYPATIRPCSNKLHVSSGYPIFDLPLVHLQICTKEEPARVEGMKMSAGVHALAKDRNEALSFGRFLDHSSAGRDQMLTRPGSSPARVQLGNVNKWLACHINGRTKRWVPECQLTRVGCKLDFPQFHQPGGRVIDDVFRR